MNECVFCNIINGKLPSYKVYEDDDFYVFLNIKPNSNGDMLLIPKKHTENILDFDSNLAGKLLDVQKKLYIFIKNKLKCDGITFSFNNEYGQEIKHFHIHITPRYLNDNIEFTYNKDLLENIETVYDKLN